MTNPPSTLALPATQPATSPTAPPVTLPANPGKAQPIEMTLSPIEAFRRWPTHTPLAAIWADPAGKPWSRWVILAQPTGETQPVTEAFEGAPWRQGTHPTAAPLNPQSTGKSGFHPEDYPPFSGGWIGQIGYELGRRIEPAARDPSRLRHTSGEPESPWADGVLLRCDSGWACDTWTGQWWRFGTPPDIASAPPSPPSPLSPRPGTFKLGAMVSEMGRKAYCQRVARIVQYIRAGDIFQANLTHRLLGPFTGSARDLFATLAASVRPHHGAYLELPSPFSPAVPAAPARAIVSMSPELMLAFDPATRRVVTRPMKGTSSAHLDPSVLARSTKDQAELNMIVDLMRNDLGRVCAFGSVVVEESRVIERHGGQNQSDNKDEHTGGVHQGVATISGQLRDGFTLADLIRATFPPGSVTGTPKIRAMQIIEELEPTPRGPYCGAIGYISDSGHAKFNVTIRTATITENTPTQSTPQTPQPNPSADPSAKQALATFPHTFTRATLSYGVGAGIVADSIPENEWNETITKAGILRTVATSVQAT